MNFKNLIVLVMIALTLTYTDGVFAQTAATNPTNNADELAPPQQSKKTPSPQPYQQENFPDWANYSFRFVAVAVGSVPFSLLLSTVMYDINKTREESLSAGAFQNQYLPLLFSGPEKPPYEDEEVQQLILATLAVSLTVSVVDLVILLIRRQRGDLISSVIR